MELRREHDALVKEAEELEKLLANPGKQKKRLKSDLTSAARAVCAKTPCLAAAAPICAKPHLRAKFRWKR